MVQQDPTWDKDFAFCVDPESCEHPVNEEQSFRKRMVTRLHNYLVKLYSSDNTRN